MKPRHFTSHELLTDEFMEWLDERSNRWLNETSDRNVFLRLYWWVYHTLTQKRVIRIAWVLLGITVLYIIIKPIIDLHYGYQSSI